MRHGARLNGTSHQPPLDVCTAPAPPSARATTLTPLYATRNATSARPERVERRVMRLLRGHPDLARSAAPTNGDGTTHHFFTCHHDVHLESVDVCSGSTLIATNGVLLSCIASL